MKRLVLVSAALLGMSTSGAAQNYQIWGAGSYSCRTWTSDQSSRWQAYADAEWLWGFVSGMALSGTVGNPGGFTDAHGLTAWVTNYCATHPTEYIVSAARAFVRFTQRPRR